MAKKAGKKTQSNRSNKTRRNVRNRKNTKKQKRRTNKQNRKKRTTRKRHGVKRGGAAAEGPAPAPAPAAEGPVAEYSQTLQNRLPAIVSPKGNIVELMAHHLNNRKIYDCVTVIFQARLEPNDEYKSMLLASDATAAIKNGIVEADKQTGRTMTTKNGSSFIDENMRNAELRLLALDGENSFDREILQPKLQKFYDLGTLLKSLSTEYNERDIMKHFEKRVGNSFRIKILNMMPLFQNGKKDPTEILCARIIENVCILIQGMPNVKISGTGVTLYNMITNRISDIYNDLAKVVSIVYDKDPTIVLTLINLIISEELVIKTLAKNRVFFPVDIPRRRSQTFMDLFRNVYGLAQYPNIEGTAMTEIDFSKLLFHNEPLKPLGIDQILKDVTNIWWVNGNLSNEKRVWIIDKIPFFNKSTDSPILFSALFRVLCDIEEGGLENIEWETFNDIFNIFMGMHKILKAEIVNWARKWAENTFASIAETGIKTSIIQTIEDNKHKIFETLKIFNSLGLHVKQRIMNSIDKVIDDLVARYVYVDIVIKNNQSLETREGLTERKEMLGRLKRFETQVVVNDRWKRLDELEKGAQTILKKGVDRVVEDAETDARKANDAAEAHGFFAGDYFKHNSGQNSLPHDPFSIHQRKVRNHHREKQKTHKRKGNTAKLVANAARMMVPSSSKKLRGKLTTLSGPHI
jgi:hypothetical protein